MNSMAIAFAGGLIDRADHLRGDPQALAGLMNHRARLLRLDGLEPVAGEDGALASATPRNKPRSVKARIVRDMRLAVHRAPACERLACRC